MEITAVVLHKGSLAHYTVSQKSDGTYEAHLLRYGGNRQDKPPKGLGFVKDGRHCTGNTQEEELMDELCAAIKLENEKANGGDAYNAA